jgi:hypothetical protein
MGDPGGGSARWDRWGAPRVTARRRHLLGIEAKLSQNLIGERQDVRLVYLKGDMQLISQRLSKRRGHFMPATLLQSQFDTLEEPGPARSCGRGQASADVSNPP